MNESIETIEAFEYYFALIERGYNITKSIEATAEHCNVTDRCVWKWYKELGWKDKTNKKKIEIAEELDAQSTKTYADNRMRYLQVLHKLLDRFIKDGFPVEIKSTKDLEIVIRNCLVLQDKPTEVIKTTNTNHNIEMNDLFDDDLMREIVKQESDLLDDDYIENNVDEE